MPLSLSPAANHLWQHQQRPRRWSTGALLCSDVLWKTVLWNAVTSVCSLSVSGLSFKWYRKAAPVFLAESSPLHTLETFFFSLPPLLSLKMKKNFAKKARLFGPWTDRGNWYSAVVWIARLVGAEGADNIEISSEFLLCFPPKVTGSECDCSQSAFPTVRKTYLTAKFMSAVQN